MGFVPLANIAKSSSNVFLPKWSNVDPGKQLVTHSLKFHIPKQKHWCAPYTAALRHFTFSPPSNCPTKRERDAMGRQMDARLVHVELNPHWMRGINWASLWFYEGSSLTFQCFQTQSTTRSPHSSLFIHHQCPLCISGGGVPSPASHFAQISAYCMSVGFLKNDDISADSFRNKNTSGIAFTSCKY